MGLFFDVDLSNGYKANRGNMTSSSNQTCDNCGNLITSGGFDIYGKGIAAMGSPKARVCCQKCAREWAENN